MSLDNAPDGRLLLYCFAGCSFVEIREALIRRGLLAKNDNQPRRKPPPFKVRTVDLLVLQNVIKNDRALSAAWSTGNVDFFISRFVALRRGCAGADMAARCAALDLGPDLHGFVCSLFGVGP